MATTVPDTDTFTLQDVVDVVNPTTDDLVDCIADADPLGWDPAYEGSKNNLLNFRNYDVTPSIEATPAIRFFEINGDPVTPGLDYYTVTIIPTGSSYTISDAGYTWINATKVGLTVTAAPDANGGADRVGYIVITHGDDPGEDVTVTVSQAGTPP